MCSNLGAGLALCNGEDDHVHLLAGYPPMVSVTALVNSFTGVSARMLRQRYRIRTHCERLWPPPISRAPLRCAAVDHPAIR